MVQYVFGSKDNRILDISISFFFRRCYSLILASTKYQELGFLYCRDTRILDVCGCFDLQIIHFVVFLSADVIHLIWLQLNIRN